MGELRRQVGSAYAIHDLLLFVSGCFCFLLVQTRKAKKQTVAKPAKTGKRMETKEKMKRTCNQVATVLGLLGFTVSTIRINKLHQLLK